MRTHFVHVSGRQKNGEREKETRRRGRGVDDESEKVGYKGRDGEPGVVFT